VRDIDSNGQSELLVSTSDAIHVVTQTSTLWKETAFVPLDYVAAGIEIADMNNDGIPDLIPWNDPRHDVLLWRVDGTYQRLQEKGCDTLFVRSLSVTDYDRDGFPDLVTSDMYLLSPRGYVSILRNQGNGLVECYSDVPTGPISGAVIADVDRDGWPDIITASPDGLSVIRNGCAANTLRIAASPGIVREGESVNVFAQGDPAEGATAFGLISIQQGGVTVAHGDGAMLTWKSPPLSAGIYNFTATYVDANRPPATTSLAVTVFSAQTRFRTVRH
jgi:hypothetical protein